MLELLHVKKAFGDLTYEDLFELPLPKEEADK